MSRNELKHGTSQSELVRAAGATISSVMPSAWEISVELQPTHSRSRRSYQPDALLSIVAPDGVTAVVLIECKGVVVPRDVASVAEQLNSVAVRSDLTVEGAMLVAPFISPTTRAQLDQRGIGWFDITGNLRLRLDRPVVFLDRAGAERSGFRDPEDRQLKSLRGPAAAKVVLELCETSLPVGVRELAERAQVGAGTSARVLELLDREAVVDRNEDGTVISVRKRSLVDRWTQDYKVLVSNEVIAALDPRGLSSALKKLPSVGAGVAVTGSAAARAYLPDDVTPVSPLVSLSLYADDPIGLIDQLGLKAVERGANVLVMRPYDNVVYAKARTVAGIEYAPPAQVVADLVTGAGRSSEEAEQLIAALESTEQGWEG